MGTATSDFFSLLGDPHFLLGSAVIFVLLTYLTWKLLHSYPVGERISLWGRHMHPPLLLKLLAKLWPAIEWVHSKARDLEAAPHTPGIAMRLLLSTEEGVSQAPWQRIRQLLCDDPACAICERAAREAGQYTVSAGTPSSHEPVDLKLGLPGRRSHQTFTRSSSVPSPTSVPFDSGPVRPGSCHSSPSSPGIKKSQKLHFEEHPAHVSDEHHQLSHQSVEAFTSSSSICRFTWTKSSSGLSEFSDDSLTFSRSIHHLKMVLTEQQDNQESSWTDSKGSSEHQLGQQKSLFPQKRPYSQSPSLRTAAHLPAGASKDQATPFTVANTLFLEDAVRASLESHVLVKRVHHHLGLPLTLLRSLRSLLPSPDLTPRRHPQEFDVVTRPQALSFVGSGTRKKLEWHLKKMVRLKRWQLPQKIQEALSHMKPPFQPREKKSPSAARKQGPGVTCQANGARGMQRTSARLPTTEGVLDAKTTRASQAELQSHLVKKSLQIRLEIFPTIVGHSQKMSSRSRILHLPKLILLGQSCPQRRNRLCLLLRSKADAVDMNIKCKYIHFLWGLPTLYMQSLSKIAPSAPALPMAPVWVHATVEFVSMQPPFVDAQVLEYHILRKRLQHQWGLPGLALRSVRQFFVPMLLLPTRAPSVLCGCLKIKILIGATQFLSTHLEIMEKLETHVKAKIIERRWGLPRRALDSLRVFIPVTPPLSKRPKENKKTFAFPQGEKVMRKKPSSRAPRTSKKLMVSSGKALQRHLTKKALEVRLGAIAPMAQWSKEAAHRLGKKHTLPKAIPPGLRPLVPRSQELLFVDQAVLGHLQLNIIHKGLMYRWGLVTIYNKSLARMFQDTRASPVAPTPSISPESKFAAVQTLFISQGDREVLEWHVRRKSLQHIWGLPGLIHRSLHYLLPDTLSFGPRKGRHTEVVVSLTEPTFLDKATRRDLERNVQKRIISQQWQLPRRVLASLRLLNPTWKADTLRQNPPQFPFSERRGSFSRKAGRPNLPASPITDALCAECYIREMGAQGFPTLGSKNLEKIELHMTKKCVEVQLESFPAVIKRSWKCTSSMSGLPLPKLVLPGQKPLQPRKSSLPLVSQEDAGRMEVAVRLCHLMSLWGLGTRYVEGLHAMIPSTPLHSLRRRRRSTFEFSEGQVLFLDGQAREALELHVRKKRLQHEWGLPVLILSSMQAFVQGFPLAPAFHRTSTHVQTLQQDPAFLSQGACSHLEHHLQRLKLQRQWGLPLRVLKSLHLLMPETETRPLERTMMLSMRSFSTETRGSFHRKSWVEDGEQDNKEPPETVGAAPCQTCQGSMLRGAALEKMERHLAKKSVEIRLELFPAVPRLSWRRVLSSLKQPLPKLIPADHRVLEPRRSSFPFLKAEEMDRIELALRCSRLASLWGLGTRYVKTLAAMAPGLPFRPIRSRKAAFGLPEGQPPFSQGLDLSTLEMHIQKKRMQHEWGLPALTLRSLGSFVQGTPALPRLPKSVIHTCVLLQELSFLPRTTRSLLEFHIQRMKLQRTWGLPGRILAALRVFLPSASWGKPTLLLSYKEERFEQAGSSAGETQRALQADRRTKCFSSKKKGLEDHLKKKDLETRLGAFPALVSQSQAAASGWGKTHLPKLVRAGQKHLMSRVASPSFLLPSTVDLLEVNVKRKHLAFLWGLPSQYMESLSMFAPRGHPPIATSRRRIRFQEGKTPFCQTEARERLEHHIQKKRLHHHWGLPSAIQRSLRAWGPTLSTWAHPRQKRSKEVNVLVAGIPFISAVAQKKLETSLKKMIIQGRWGLPKRLQGYLRAFTVSPLSDRELEREEAANGGIMACIPDRKRAPCITQPPQATSVGLVSRQAPSQPSVSPILGLFRSSKISALETHLKKKSLEIKFQSQVVDVGTIKQTPLPKCPPLFPVLKPRGAVLFVEPEALLKVTLNIKHKYLTYLWGLPSLLSESLKKMFGSVPKWPQKKCPKMAEEEATWKGHETIRPGKGTGNSAGFGSRSLKFPKVKLSFLSGEALDLLESHVRRKKLQHEWGLPSTIQKSLRAFAPSPSGVQRAAQSSRQPVMRPCCVEVSVILQSPLFLDLATRRQLEEHVRSRTAAHRWGIPKRVQHSLKMFLLPVSLSQRSQDRAQTLPSHCDPIPRATAKHPQSKAAGLHGWAESRQVSLRRAPPQEGGTQPPLLRSVEYPAELSPEAMHQGQTPRHGRKTPEKMPRPAAKFLTSQASDLLEFHVRHKRIQHEWGLPSIVQKSLQAFAPLRPDSRVSMKPRAGAYMAAKSLRVEGTAGDHTPLSIAEVSVPFQAVMFLDQDVKSRLEAHVRSRTTSHRWGLPKLVQDSLRAFLPAELCSQAHSYQSHQQHETHSDSEGQETPELLRVKHRDPEKQGKRVAGTKGTAFIFPENKPSFLTDEALGLLEFHIQQKKLQHLWGLPSTMLKSLHAFAPFPFETEKNMQHPAKITTEICSWVRGDVQVITPNLLFLSPETKLRLDAHLKNMVAKHRWGLPARVQQSLKGFLPPRPSSPVLAQAQPVSAPSPKSVQVAAAGEGHHDDSMPRRKTANRKNIHQKEQLATPPGSRKTTAFLSPLGRLLFLTDEAQELLEFHMQRKKVQHMWGLPSAVLKSLRAFAPCPREPEKHGQDAAETLTKRSPWDTEVCVPVQSLFFLGPDTKEGLEAHVRSRTAEHRWGLPKLVQKSLRALLPPASFSQSGETRRPLLHLNSESPQAPVIPPQIGTERSVQKLPGSREASKELEEKPVATSSAASATPPATDLPFLTDSKQEVLEFHIQRKKVQHEWGLPLTVQKSVHAFAPVPPQPHLGVLPTAGGNALVAGAKEAIAEMGVGTKKPWATGRVNVTVPSLHFLDSDTKEYLEAHLRNLTIEHRWGLPRLVHKSMRAFIPLPSHLDIREMEDQEQPLACSWDKPLAVSDAQLPTEVTKEAGSEDQRIYRSELWHETKPGGETAFCLATEEPLFSLGTKPEHAMAIPGGTGRWKAGKEPAQRSTLQKSPHLKKATQRQRSMVFEPRQDPRTPSFSSSSPGPNKYRCNASSWSTSLPRARYSRGRISSGRAPIPRSSKIRKGMSQQVEHGFQRTAVDSHPQAGTKQPQAPAISYSSWELGRKKHAFPCVCCLRAYRDDSGSLLPLDAEERCRKDQGTEADSSEDTDLKNSGLSSEESLRDGPPRQAGGACQGKTNSKLQKRGSRLGWNKEKKKALRHLSWHQPSVRAFRRMSSEDLCEACHSLKPRRLPKGSGNLTSETGSSSTDSGELSPRRPPVSQGHPAPGLQAETDEDVADRKAKGGTLSSSKEPRPLSTGGVSQFSTECEWERVGDWDMDEEATRGGESLSKEQGGSSNGAGERPSMEAGLKAQRSLKWAGSPAAQPSQTSPNSAVQGPDVVEIERNSVLGPGSKGRRMVGGEASGIPTVMVAGPEGSKNQRTREEEDKTLHRKKGGSRKGPLPDKEALARHGSHHLSGVPRGTGPPKGEALKMVQQICKGIQEQGNQAEFIQGVSTKGVHQKLSLLGTIVEKKLLLRQGFRVWVQSQEGERGGPKRATKSTRASQPPTFQATQRKWVEVQCCGSLGVATPRSSDRALLAGPQQRQAGKMRSPTLAGPQQRQAGKMRSPTLAGPQQRQAGKMRSPTLAGPQQRQAGKVRSPTLVGPQQRQAGKVRSPTLAGPQQRQAGKVRSPTPAGPQQQQQAGKMRSPTLPGNPPRTSHRRKKEVTRGRSRSRERKK